MKIIQSEERKNSSVKYCARHKMHYLSSCHYCDLEQGTQKYLEVTTHKKVNVEIGVDNGI